MLSDAVPDTPMLAVAVEYAAALVGLVTAIVGATTSVVPAEGELGAAGEATEILEEHAIIADRAGQAAHGRLLLDPRRTRRRANGLAVTHF